MKASLKRLKSLFHWVDNDKYTILKELLDDDTDEEMIEQFESNQKWISQCFNKPDLHSLRMNALNEVLEGHGVETIRGSEWDSFYGDVTFEYINVGDSYTPTVIYDIRNDKFKLKCIADVA